MQIVSSGDTLHEVSGLFEETICMKCQSLFIMKENKKKYFKMSSENVTQHAIKRVSHMERSW